MKDCLPLLNLVGSRVDAWKCCSFLATMRESGLRRETPQRECQAKSHPEGTQALILCLELLELWLTSCDNTVLTRKCIKCFKLGESRFFSYLQLKASLMI